MNTPTSSNLIRQAMNLLHSKGFKMCEIYDAYETAHRITPIVEVQVEIMNSLLSDAQEPKM